MLPHAPRRPHTCQLNDSGLELLTILVSLKLWQARLRGCTFEILTDNQVSVYALNNQRSSDHFMQCCRSPRNLVGVSSEQYPFNRAPHLWSNQCLS